MSYLPGFNVFVTMASSAIVNVQKNSHSAANCWEWLLSILKPRQRTNPPITITPHFMRTLPVPHYGNVQSVTKAEWLTLKPCHQAFCRSSIHHDDFGRLETATNRKPQSEPSSTCASIGRLYLHTTAKTNSSRPFPTRSAFSALSFTANPTAPFPTHAAILALRHIRPRFNTHLQFNNQDCNIFRAVQSKSSLANRRGYPHLVSDSAWFAAALG